MGETVPSDMHPVKTQIILHICAVFVIATDKRGIHIIFFLFLDENKCCGTH